MIVLMMMGKWLLNSERDPSLTMRIFHTMPPINLPLFPRQENMPFITAHTALQKKGKWGRHTSLMRKGTRNAEERC